MPPLIFTAVASTLFIILGFSRIVAFWSFPNPPTVTLKIVLVAFFYLLFFFSAVFALSTNIIYITRRRNGSLRTLGGYLAHVGFAVMLLGVLFSSSFGEKTKATIPAGGARTALGYDIKFVGTERTGAKEEQTNFEVRKGDAVFAAHSVSKEMRRGNDIQVARTPHIKKYLLSDLYLSLENITEGDQINMQPLTLGQGGKADFGDKSIVFAGFDSEENKRLLAKNQPLIFDIAKGETIDISGRKVTFEKFEMAGHEQGMASTVGAVMHVELNGQTTAVTPTYEPLAGGDHRSHAVDLPGGGAIALAAIRADIGAVSLSYSTGEQTEAPKLGTDLLVITDADTARVTPVLDPNTAHGEASVATFADGSQLFLVDIDARNDSASYVYVPSQEPMLATIEISTKPMINLVWLGFLTIVVGAAVAVYRRMKESKLKE
jgi:hypothetical protein